MTEQGPSTVTDPTDDACPGCGATSGVQSTLASPKVQAWTCTACRTDWAITVINPQTYFDRLAATVEQLSATRAVLRQVITLADHAVTLSDKELRDQLIRLADRARLGSAPWLSPFGYPKGESCPNAPAGRRFE
jgi:ribosomal protein L37AE/L43A